MTASSVPLYSGRLLRSEAVSCKLMAKLTC